MYELEIREERCCKRRVIWKKMSSYRAYQGKYRIGCVTQDRLKDAVDREVVDGWDQIGSRYRKRSLE